MGRNVTHRSLNFTEPDKLLNDCLFTKLDVSQSFCHLIYCEVSLYLCRELGSIGLSLRMTLKGKNEPVAMMHLVSSNPIHCVGSVTDAWLWGDQFCWIHLLVPTSHSFLLHSLLVACERRYQISRYKISFLPENWALQRVRTVWRNVLQISVP